jgi:2-polyprenyl-3-methyl-5-hydroxy-6-metoxy-1,4-benzoquinol methylase
MPTQTTIPSPALIFENLNAYQRTAALKAGIELDIFTGIGGGADTAPALAASAKTSERGMRILCDYLVVAGLLGKDGKRYRLTPDSAAFLDRRSPACLAGTLQFLGHDMLTSNFKDIAAIVRKGGTVTQNEGTLAAEHPIWIDFARSMVPLMRPGAEFIAGLIGGRDQKCRVLDIAAGHGLFGITLAQRNPQAEIVALDWPNVLTVAKENAKAAGVESRYRTLPGDALQIDYGSGYDIVLLTNFLHHFDVPTCEKILTKVRKALNPGGRAVTLEFVPNEDRVSPPPAATFSMMMLGSTPSGDAYTFSEFDKMFRAAGFSRSELHPISNYTEQVIVSYR